MPLLPLVAGGMMAAGAIGSFLSRPRASDFQYNVNTNDLTNLANQVSNPNFGFEEDLRLLQQSAPTTDSILGAYTATGGSNAQGASRADELNQERYNSYFRNRGQNQLQRLNLGGNLLSRVADIQSRGQLAQTQFNMQRRQSNQQLWGGLFNSGATLMGGDLMGLYGRQGARQGADTGHAFQQMALPPWLMPKPNPASTGYQGQLRPY